MFNRLVNRIVYSTTSSCTTNASRCTVMIKKNTSSTTNGLVACSFHVDIKSNHFVMTEEKRVFLEALKLELFSSRSNVANMIKDNSQQTSSYSRVVSNDDGFDKSLENSRNLMCHKRHDVLTQQQSEYFLYL